MERLQTLTGLVVIFAGAVIAGALLIVDWARTYKENERARRQTRDWLRDRGEPCGTWLSQCRDQQAHLIYWQLPQSEKDKMTAERESVISGKDLL